ncbi:unnamed protein product [Moneuplotes crassus]|uniref:Uncharacterized protein n=1 Tax=Euplotes crassus TaxID=5936 RepID=A0AAD1XV39_EUPCR|nr:unnamed protein product [Moneuplotes crassus]
MADLKGNLVYQTLSDSEESIDDLRNTREESDSHEIIQQLNEVPQVTVGQPIVFDQEKNDNTNQQRSYNNYISNQILIPSNQEVPDPVLPIPDQARGGRRHKCSCVVISCLLVVIIIVFNVVYYS